MSTYQFPNQPPRPYQPAPKRSSSKIVWIILGIVGGIGVLGCGCCGALFTLGAKADAQDMAAAVKDDPNVRREIGEIKTCKINWSETWAVESDTVYIYDVTGPNGSGKLIIEDDWGINSARLKTARGEWELEVNEVE